MELETQSSNKKLCATPVADTIIAKDLVAHPFVFFLESRAPFVEITLSDTQKLLLNPCDLEKYLATADYTLPSSTQILQANFRHMGALCYEIDFERTLTWNTRLLNYTMAQLETTKAQPPSPICENHIKKLTAYFQQQRKNLQHYFNTPSCPDKPAIIAIFTRMYTTSEHILQEQAVKKATLLYFFLHQKTPHPDAIEFFTQKPWIDLFEQNYAFAQVIDQDKASYFFDAARLEDFLEHANRKNPLTTQSIDAVIFRKLDTDFNCKIAIEKTLDWNIVLIKETKTAYDTALARLENITAKISTLENRRAALLQQQSISAQHNEKLLAHIDTLRMQEIIRSNQQENILRTINQQSLIIEKCVQKKSCPVTVRFLNALTIAETLFDINRFDTTAGAYAWITLAKQSVTHGSFTPETTALYYFLCGQRARMDGCFERAYEFLIKAIPKFLKPKHSAQRDFVLAQAGLCSLPTDLTPKQYDTLVAIQTHLDRAHRAALGPDGQSLLLPLETATLQECRTKTTSLFNFLYAMRLLPGDGTAFEALQKIDPRFLSKRNLAQKDLWLTGYYIHHLLPEICPEQRRQLTQASEHLGWAQAESFDMTGSSFSPEEQTLCAAYRDQLEKQLALYQKNPIV